MQVTYSSVSADALDGRPVSRVRECIRACGSRRARVAQSSTRAPTNVAERHRVRAVHNLNDDDNGTA